MLYLTIGCSSIAGQGVSREDHDTDSNRPEIQPQDTIVDLKITDLLGFLQQYQTSCSDLRMVCPPWGVPLPSIQINLYPSLGLTAKIELSLPSCDVLLKQMYASRIASAEVSQ